MRKALTVNACDDYHVSLAKTNEIANAIPHDHEVDSTLTLRHGGDSVTVERFLDVEVQYKKPKSPTNDWIDGSNKAKDIFMNEVTYSYTHAIYHLG